MGIDTEEEVLTAAERLEDEEHERLLSDVKAERASQVGNAPGVSTEKSN